MKNNSKFLLLWLKEKNGEYEYLHRSIHELPDSRINTAERVSKNYAKTFYWGKAEPEDGGFYFHGGEVFVQISNWKFISENEYNVLKNYL